MNKYILHFPLWLVLYSQSAFSASGLAVLEKRGNLSLNIIESRIQNQSREEEGDEELKNIKLPPQ